MYVHLIYNTILYVVALAYIVSNYKTTTAVSDGETAAVDVMVKLTSFSTDFRFQSIYFSLF